MSKKRNPDHAALPDRWDGDVYRFGKQVMPKPGPEIAVRWGDLLRVEKNLRDIQDGLRDVLKADEEENPVEDGDYTDVNFNASTTLGLAVFLETYVRGLRTGKWPDQELDQLLQSPPENLASSTPSRDDDDPDAPF